MSKRKMRTAKVLHLLTEEGVAIQTQVATKNKWKTFHFVTRFNPTNGYRGTYRGKQVFYKERLPEGKVRHHIKYDDDDPNNHIVFVTRKEHSNIHRGEGGKICHESY